MMISGEQEDDLPTPRPDVEATFDCFSSSYLIPSFRALTERYAVAGTDGRLSLITAEHQSNSWTSRSDSKSTAENFFRERPAPTFEPYKCWWADSNYS